MDDAIDNRVRLAKLLEKKEVSSGTFDYKFKLEHSISYEAGQYVWLELPTMRYPDPKGDRRAFSITNPPSNGDEISILFRRGESGYKKTLVEMEVGEEANIVGPFGSAFTFPKDELVPLVLMAGGVGISPFLCLVRDAFAKNSGRNISLLYSDNKKCYAAFNEELENICKERGNFRFASLGRKMEQEDILSFKHSDDAQFYISGTSDFVDHAYNLLSQNGVFCHRMRFENFYPATARVYKAHELFTDSGVPVVSMMEDEYTRRRQNLFLSAVESSSQHIIITDTNGLVLFANKTAEEKTGYSFTEMRGHTPRLWGGMMPKEFYEKLWKDMVEGKIINEEMVNRRKDGRIYHVMAHISPILDEAGEIIAYIGTEEDITHLKERDFLLASLNARFNLATKAAKIGIWEWDLEKERMVWDEHMFSLYGLPKDSAEDPYKIWKESVHPDDKTKRDQEIKKVLFGEKILELIYRIVWPDGEIKYLKAFANVERNEEGRVTRMVGVNWDVTLEQSIDKAKTEFVSLASHQLKTPIGSVSWDLEMLLNGDYGKLTEKQKAIVEQIYNTNMRMKELVDGLLNISRIDLGTLSIEPIPVNFAEVCEDVLIEMTPRITIKKHEIVKDYSKEMIEVPADPKLLRIIFQNFISNAVKYTPDGGRITISIKAHDHEVKIAVANNGIAIPKEDQPKIFSKMFRAEGAEEMDPDGNGLGLYLVKAIVEEGGGKTWFESEPGKDTIFYASFPISGMKRRQGSKTLE
jgi:PAS domain S-box-containing protein